MANMYFNDEFKVCSIGRDPAYLYIDNVEDFLNDCGDNWISDGVDKTGVYQWNGDYCVWDLADPKIDDNIRALVEEINALRQKNSSQNNNEIAKWNIVVILKTGETIVINSEPISIDEVHEVIDTLLKPSFFGKTILSFKIVAE